MAWLDRRRFRVALNAAGEVERFMKIVSPPGVNWSGANDGTVAPDVAVAVEAWPDNIRGKVYGSPAACETAMELNIDLPETTALLDAMDDAPSPAERTDINLLMVALLPVLSKIDIFYVSAAHARQAGRLNWVDPDTFVAQEVNGPIFVNNRGFQSDPDRTSYVDTTFNPVTAALLYARDSAHVGVYVTNEANAQDMPAGGSSKTYILPRTAGTNMRARGNTGAITSTATISPVSKGHALWTRSDAGSYLMYKDGASILSVNHDSQALVSENMTFCGVDYDPGSTHVIGAFHVGGALTAQDVAIIHAGLSAYMSSRGV